MQFQVPQFIDSDPKIVGPLTLKQFLYLAGGATITFMSFFVFAFPLFLVIAVIFGSIAAALAFVKINGRPFPLILRYAVGYLLKPRIYLWQQPGATPAQKPAPQAGKGDGRLKNLFFALLTTTRPIERREKSSKPFHLFGQSEPVTRWQTLRHTTGEKDSARRVDYR